MTTPERQRRYHERHKDEINARRRAKRRASKPAAPAVVVAKPRRATATGVAKWIRGNVVVPDGRLAGQPFKLQGWQVRFLKGALADGVLQAGLSVARKCGKTTAIAAVLLAHLVKPPSAFWHGVVTSLTAKNAAELRRQLAKLVVAGGFEDAVQVLRSPAPGMARGLNGSTVDFLAADRGSGHSASADLAIIDEGGLMTERDRDLWQAMASCTGARDGRLLVVSMRGKGPMFDELAERHDHPSVYWQEHAAPDGCDIDDVKAWRKANPALGTIKSMDYMRGKASMAVANPREEGHFRLHELNQRSDGERLRIVSPGDWRACETTDLPPRDGHAFLGFDAGGSDAMTALCAVWPATWRVELYAGLPAVPDIAMREKADRVPPTFYRRLVDSGELKLYPGRVTPLAEFLADCGARLAGVNVVACGADRYRSSEFLEALEAADVHWKMDWRGTGAHAKAQGSEDVRRFQRLVWAEKLRCAPSPIMRMAINESELRHDGAGNPALDKARSRSRIDVLQAAVIACSMADAYRPKRFLWA